MCYTGSCKYFQILSCCLTIEEVNRWIKFNAHEWCGLVAISLNALILTSIFFPQLNEKKVRGDQICFGMSNGIYIEQHK